MRDPPNLTIERIVSHGQQPPGFWYAQDRGEWVLLLAGTAALLIEGEPGPRLLRSGDFLDLPAHTRHRVEWTDRAQPTVWLAVHYDQRMHRRAHPITQHAPNLPIDRAPYIETVRIAIDRDARRRQGKGSE